MKKIWTTLAILPLFAICAAETSYPGQKKTGMEFDIDIRGGIQ